MSVKFWEMKFDGTEYIDNNGFIWELDGTKKNFFADVGVGISMLTIHYTQKQLIEITFEEYVVLSDDELTILKNIDKRYNFIARDDDGKLYAYMSEPVKSYTKWGVKYGNQYTSLIVFSHLFKMVKNTDEKATSIYSLVEQNTR